MTNHVTTLFSYYMILALSKAVFDKLVDGTFAGRIPPCPGVMAFAATLKECEVELRSTLGDWILVGLKLGHTLPLIDGIDLITEPRRERVEAVLASRLY